VLLDTKNRVQGISTVYIGSLNASMVRVGEIFKEAVRRNSAALIVSHNHPNGDPTPSPEDILVTHHIVSAGKMLDIDVLDHLIIGRRVMGRTADDRIADDQEARLAEIERAAFVERTANGRQAKIKRGHYPGGGQPPYGYRVEGRGPETQLVIDEEHAAASRLNYSMLKPPSCASY
jgi:hypothetical protein